MAESLKNTTVRGVLWSFFERFSTQFVQFVTTVIMARILTPEDYGLIGMIAIFMALSEIFIDGGFSRALIQKKDRTEVDLNTAFYINLGISLLIYVILYTSAPLISLFFEEERLTLIIRIYSLSLIINSFAAINKTILIIKIDFKTQAQISLISALIAGFVGIFLAYRGYGVWAIVYFTLTGSIANVIFSLIYVRWFPKKLFSVRSFKELFTFGSKLLAANMISSLYTNIYTFVIGKRYSPGELGFYIRANQFAQFVSTNISTILERVAFPTLSKLQDSNEELLRGYKRFLEVSSFIMFPLILGLCGVARPLIILLLTDKWEPSVLLLQILCVGFLGDCVNRLNINVLYVKGRTDLALKNEIIKKSIAFIILFISMFYSVIGICVGFAIYSYIALFINSFYTKSLIGYSIKNQFLDLLPYLFNSILIFLEALILGYIIKNMLLAVISSVIICSLTYAVLCKFQHLYGYVTMELCVKNYLKKTK